MEEGHGEARRTRRERGSGGGKEDEVEGRAWESEMGAGRERKWRREHRVKEGAKGERESWAGRKEGARAGEEEDEESGEGGEPRL